MFICFIKVKFNMFILSFDSENDHGWDIEIQDDVIEECNKHGGVIHIYVDKKSAEVCYLVIITVLNKVVPCRNGESAVIFNMQDCLLDEQRVHI